MTNVGSCHGAYENNSRLTSRMFLQMTVLSIINVYNNMVHVPVVYHYTVYTAMHVGTDMYYNCSKYSTPVLVLICNLMSDAISPVHYCASS